MAWKKYTAVDSQCDVHYIYTHTSQDDTERIVASSSMSCGTRGRNAPINKSWEFAVLREDECHYGSTTAQIWVDSVEFQGDIFNPSEFTYVVEGIVSPYHPLNLFSLTTNR